MTPTDSNREQDNAHPQALGDIDMVQRLSTIDDVFRSTVSSSSSSSLTQPMKHSAEDYENLQDVKMEQDKVRDTLQEDDEGDSDKHLDNGGDSRCVMQVNIIMSRRMKKRPLLISSTLYRLRLLQAVQDRQKEKEDQKQQAKVLLGQLKEKRIQKVKGNRSSVDISSRLNDVLGSVDKAQAVVKEMIAKKVQSPIRKIPDASVVACLDSKMTSVIDAKESGNSDHVDENVGGVLRLRAEEKDADSADEADAELEVLYVSLH